MFDHIEGTDEWKRAPAHRIRSRTGDLFAIFAVGLAVTCVLIVLGLGVDDGGVLALVIIGAACAVAWSMRDSSGGTSTSYVLCVATRGGPKKLGVDRELVEPLAPGQSVIAFVRRGNLDAAWQVSSVPAR